jgi:hypothetical protein
VAEVIPIYTSVAEARLGVVIDRMRCEYDQDRGMVGG